MTEHKTALPTAVLQALRFYASGDHIHIDDEHQEFDTVSGEPENWLMSQKDDDGTMLEDGTIAKMALTGISLTWSDGGDAQPPDPVAGEIYQNDSASFDGPAVVAALRAAATPATVPDNSQDWKGISGAVAFQLIERKADDWDDIGRMMDEWMAANQSKTSQQPITDEMIDGLWASCFASERKEAHIHAFARAIEAAHGIRPS